MLSIDPVWLVVHPRVLAGMPSMMSPSVSFAIQACPRQWALINAEYPDVWACHGFPQKKQLSILKGEVTHLALEKMIKAYVFIDKNKKPISITTIIEECIDEIIRKESVNPRMTRLIRYVQQRLMDARPEIREKIQMLLGNVHPYQKNVCKETSGHTSKRFPLVRGSYSEVMLRSLELKWKGVADLINIDDGCCEIVEFKTGARREHHKFQVEIYALLWSEDEELNPQKRLADKLIISYFDGNVYVPRLTSKRIEQLRQSLLCEGDKIIKELNDSIPRVGEENCRYCQVRHLCDIYWKVEAQHVLYAHLDQKSLRIDAELILLTREGPNSWNVSIVSCGLLQQTKEVHLFMGSCDMVFGPLMKKGDQIRVLDASLISADVGEIPVISLNMFSEIFFCE